MCPVRGCFMPCSLILGLDLEHYAPASDEIGDDGKRTSLGWFTSEPPRYHASQPFASSQRNTRKDPYGQAQGLDKYANPRGSCGAQLSPTRNRSETGDSSTSGHRGKYTSC
ncbi:hypothetical protein CDD80_5165 [Ophiocordyceps camponoti-rufipedis]|uniref:Uncharacterized protein n=1 Tax=Ophiocordyceps camponoti-rufipedis TaxID=2004952 RepID=A0A2C5ZG82_9HYPO|nr:hypothetical protein CDD80_5165 [Ophiocordyceps camponoti-rufipedis]